jgi:hypothetical protein
MLFFWTIFAAMADTAGGFLGAIVGALFAIFLKLNDLLQEVRKMNESREKNEHSRTHQG